MATEPEPQEGPKALYVNGNRFDEDDLTFREKREVRRVVAAELMGDPKADVSEAYTDDFLLATLYVVLRRDNPDLTLDEAMDLKLSDFWRTAPPTKPAAKRAK